MIASTKLESHASTSAADEPYFAIELPKKRSEADVLETLLQEAMRDPANGAVDPSLTQHRPLAVDVTENFAARETRADMTVGRAKPKTAVSSAERMDRRLLAQLDERVRALFGAAMPGPDAQVSAAAVEALEGRAIGVLENLMPKKLGQAEQVFDAWFTDLETRAADNNPVSAMEYVTLLHVLREKLFEKAPELAPYVPRMEATARVVHRQLTGQDAQGDLASQRLPRNLLAKSSHDVRAIHAAVFRPVDESWSSSVKDLAANYTPKTRDALIAAGVLALCFTGAGVPLLAGAVHGYVIGTFLEHGIHKYFGHASKRSLEQMERVLSKFGPIGKSIHASIVETAFSHGTIHHASYAGSYVDRFAPRDTDLPSEELEQKRALKKARIDEMAEARGPEAAEQIFASDYGRALSNAFRDALTFLPVSAVATLGTMLVGNLAGVELGALFAAMSVATSLIFVPASNNLHPYLHMPREEALAKAGPLMRRFLDSRYVAHIAQSHYMHHRDAAVNQNLVAGADIALGGYRTSPVEAVLALRKMKTFY